MTWGGCGFGAPTGQTIRWQLELLLLKTHLPRGFQLYTGPVIFGFEPWDEALALVVVWEVVYVVRQELSTFCIPGSAALRCPVWSLCPSQALVVSGLLVGVSHVKLVPIPSTRRGVRSPPEFLQVTISAFGREMLFAFCKSWPNILKEECLWLWGKYLSLFGLASFCFSLSIGLCQFYYIEGTLSWGRKLE